MSSEAILSEAEEASNYNTNNYEETIKIGLRYGLSQTQISMLANALLVDLGYKDESLFLSPSKVKRMMDRHGEMIAKRHLFKTGHRVLGVDGKRSNVRKNHCTFRVEDKQTVVDTINREYIDHYIPINGTGVAIASGLIEVRILKNRPNTGHQVGLVLHES